MVGRAQGAGWSGGRGALEALRSPGAASPALGTAQGTGPAAAPEPEALCAPSGRVLQRAALGSGVAGLVLKM